MAAKGIEDTPITEEILLSAVKEAFPSVEGQIKLDSFTSKLIGVGKGFVTNILKFVLTASFAAQYDCSPDRKLFLRLLISLLKSVQ